jgi:N-acetyltransferase B complex (NatB) non catalytic subunit
VERGEYDAKALGLLRGPYLARVEAVWRRYLLRLAPASALTSAMLAYFTRFRTRAVAPLDLRRYAAALPRESSVWLAAAVAEQRRAVAAEVRPLSACRACVRRSQEPPPPRRVHRVHAVHACARADSGARVQAATSAGWSEERVQITAACLRLEGHLGAPAAVTTGAAAEHAAACTQLLAAWQPVIAVHDARETAIGEQAAEHASAACMAAHRLSRKPAFLAQVRRRACIRCMHGRAPPRAGAAPRRSRVWKRAAGDLIVRAHWQVLGRQCGPRRC